MFFFFNDTATTEIYTLSLHDALPIFPGGDDSRAVRTDHPGALPLEVGEHRGGVLHRDTLGDDHEQLDARVDRLEDRKSTRLNSSHANISYAVFCLKKKKHTV